MKDVNSPNDKVQWATDKTTNNSICTNELVTQASVVTTHCVLVVKAKDHDLQKMTITVTLRFI